MKICATSDLHGAFPEIEPCDLLIIAGDVCPVQGSHSPARQRAWLRKEFFPWLRVQPVDHEIVWIAGNHDFVCEQPGFRRFVYEEGEGVYLQDDWVEVNGLRIYGSPWVRNLRNWAFFKEDADFQKWAEELPEADIYALHSPLAGILDGGHPEWASPFVANALARRDRCKQVICGHIHEGYGAMQLGDVMFRNVAHMNVLYEPVNPPHVFEV